MNFSESIQICFKKYADFTGRASKPEFWWWALFALVGALSLGIISNKLSTAFSVATLLPYIAVTARRLHDTNRSGWLQLIAFIPLIGWILLIIWLCQDAKSPNRFDV